MIFFYFFFAILFIGLNPHDSFSTTPSNEYLSLYCLRFVVTTSSDWTKIRAAKEWNEKFFIANTAIKTGQDKKNLKVDGFAIKNTPSDDSLVSIEYTVYLKTVPDNFSFYVMKGDMGKTVVDIYNCNKPIERYVGRFINERRNPIDPGNSQQYQIKSQKLVKGGPTLFRTSKTRYSKLLLSFYYPWYGNPSGPTKRWRAWNPKKAYASKNTPLLGYYDSKDPAIIKKHIEYAKRAGIDGFIVSWWGINSFEDSIFDNILRIAEKESFFVTIYYETAWDKHSLLNDFSYIFNKYTKSNSFLKCQGKPVLFVYSRIVKNSRREDWEFIHDKLEKSGKEFFLIGDGFSENIIPIFDGIHLYDLGFHSLSAIRKIYQQGAMYHSVIGGLFVGTVMPGYDDTVIRKPGTVIDRRNGKYYKDMWEMALRNDPQWIVITSFNEWHEGSEIEPSKEYGDEYLELTADFAKLFKAKPKKIIDSIVPP